MARRLVLSQHRITVTKADVKVCLKTWNEPYPCYTVLRGKKKESKKREMMPFVEKVPNPAVWTRISSDITKKYTVYGSTVLEINLLFFNSLFIQT